MVFLYRNHLKCCFHYVLTPNQAKTWSFQLNFLSRFWIPSNPKLTLRLQKVHMCLLCEPAEFTHLSQSELRDSTKRQKERMYKGQTAQACRPSTCTTSIYFAESAVHGTHLNHLTPLAGGVMSLDGAQSSIPVSDADFPYSFGQVSQAGNPGHIEMNDKTLIDMRPGFHLNLLAL